MATTRIIKQTIWDYQKDHIDFLYKNRGSLKSVKVRMGINISIILHSACYLEGYLEYELERLLEHRKSIMNKPHFDEFACRRIYNTFLHNLEQDLEARISRTTGLDNFDSLLELCSFRVTPTKLRDFKHWEGVKVLFQLRNVLAHGRQVSAQRISGYWTNDTWEDRFSGGYRMAENYLMKKNLSKKRFTECRSINHIFTNRVTDHFFSITKQFAKYCHNIFTIELDESSAWDIVQADLSNKRLKSTR